MGDSFLQDAFETPDGASLYFEVHGEGAQAIVLCDGLGCDGFAWKYLLPALKRDHRVLHWHYRGHGHSTVARNPDRLGMSFNCEDLEGLMRHLGMEQAILFGHSMGVQVALEFHRRAAARVAGLALLCGSYGNPLDTLHDDNKMRLAFPFIRAIVERFPALAAEVTHRVCAMELALEVALYVELNPRLLKRADLIPYMGHLAKMDPLVFVRTLASLADHSAWDHLHRVNVPTLVVGGEKDHFTPLWLSQRMAEAIPEAQLVVLPEGSHTAILEYPEVTERAVLAFLQRVARPTGERARVCQASSASV